MKDLFNFILTITIIYFTSSSCLAVTFEKATELGSVSSLSPSGAFKIEGAVFNKGEFSTDKEYEGTKVYNKGLACFGMGEAALYIHYDNSYVKSKDFMLKAFHSQELKKSCQIGDREDMKNIFPMPLAFPHAFNIYKIENDKGINLYLLQYDVDTLPSYKAVGKRPDGKWVKYFDTEAAEKYYGMKLAFCHNFYLKDNKVIFEYGRYNSEEKKFETYIELQFIWNDKDQWFGVDQAVPEISLISDNLDESDNDNDDNENDEKDEE